jgi:hypothetical protein
MPTSHRPVSLLGKAQPSRMTTEMTILLTLFDQREYRELIEARGETLRRAISKPKPAPTW